MSYYKGRNIPSVRRLLRIKETKYALESLFGRICVPCGHTHTRNVSTSAPTRRPPIKAFLNECVHAENITAPDDD